MSVFRRVIQHLNPKPLSRYLSTASGHLHSQPPGYPTSAHYDSLVHSAAASGDFNLLRRILTDRISDGCFNTTDTFKFLTTTQSSLSILPDLFESLSHLPNGLPRKNAFDSLIARLCKLRLPQLALQLFDKVRQRNLEFSTITFHPILNSLAHKRDLEECRTLLNLMKQLKSPPDTTSYNFLLTALCADGETEEAANLLEEMRRDGLEADARTYDAMVLGACRAGNVNGAIALMRAEEDAGVSVLYSTPVHVVTELMERGYYEQAVKMVIGLGEGKDKELGSECFGVLGSRLIKLKKIDEAKFVSSEMDRRGFRMGQKLKDFYNLHM